MKTRLAAGALGALLTAAPAGAATRGSCAPVAVGAPAPASAIITVARAAQTIALTRDGRFTTQTVTATQLAGELRRARPHARVALAGTLAQARRAGTVYVITSATRGRALELASAINPRVRYVARVRDGKLRFSYQRLSGTCR